MGERWKFYREERQKWINLCMVTCWQIWKHRCEIVFGNKVVSVDLVIKRIQDFLFVVPTQPIVERVGARVNGSEFQVWKPCDFGIIKINVDAAFNKANSNFGIGIGIVAREYTGGYIGCSASEGLALSAEESEGVAALRAVKWAKMKGYDQIVLEGDAQVIINFLKYGTRIVEWKTKTLLEELISYVDQFSYFDCNFVPRNCNMCADLLAKLALSQNMRDPQLWDGDPPDLIKDTLTMDTSKSIAFGFNL